MLDPEYLDAAGDMVAAVYGQIEQEMLEHLCGLLLDQGATGLGQRGLTALMLLAQTEGPYLTGIIERDRKRSTYKFALLRAVCELNIANPNCVRFREPMDAARLPAALRERVDDDAWAAVPFGLVVEKTIEYYWSILAGEVRPTDPRPAPRQIHRGQELKFKSSLLAFMRRWAGDWEAFRADWHRGRLLLRDAAEARELWRGRTVEKRVRAGSDISRYAVYGMIGGRHWTAIITYRNGATRIISVRRSRKKERMEYDSLA